MTDFLKGKPTPSSPRRFFISAPIRFPRPRPICMSEALRSDWNPQRRWHEHMSQAINDAYKFDEQGLMPAVIQDWLDGTVLMLGYMNQEAITKTLTTKSVHFWSRSRKKLWEKGETSGHKLQVKEL